MTDQSMKSLYVGALLLIERANRGLIEVLKGELDRLRRSDVTPVQASILFHLGDHEVTAGEIMSRGFYQGTNSSYNIKKLVELGFIHHERGTTNRRTVRIKLTPKGQEVRALVERLYNDHTRFIGELGGLSPDDLAHLTASLKRLSRFWTYDDPVMANRPRPAAA